MLLCAGSGILSAQPLRCPPVTTASPRCETFHYHVAMYRPDTRGMTEFYGINQFAMQTACDRARDLAFKRNMAIVEYMKPRDSNYKADAFGDCHCDMTVEKNSPNFLSEPQRLQQIRSAEEIRLRVRERLLDAGLPTDAELVRGLSALPPASPLLGGPKLVPPPAAPATAAATNPQEDLRMTKAIDTSGTQAAALDLPLVEIPIAGMTPPEPQPPAPAVGGTTPAMPAPVPAPAAATAQSAPQAQTPAQPAPAEPLPSVTVPAPVIADPPPPEPAPTPASPAPQPAPAPPASSAPQPAAQPAPAPEPTMSAEEAADRFVRVETQRISNVLSAAAVINDPDVNDKVLRACIERNAVLGNLRSLITGAGTRSRLAAAAAAAATAPEEKERLAFVAKLFGSDMPAHWAPKDAADVILNLPVDFDAERVLHDSAATADAKKRALYIFLARTQPSEQQQLWLNDIIEGFL